MVKYKIKKLHKKSSKNNVPDKTLSNNRKKEKIKSTRNKEVTQKLCLKLQMTKWYAI